jgi:hypothetical protein
MEPGKAMTARKAFWEDWRKSDDAKIFTSILPLMHCELTKSFPSTTARVVRSDWVRVCIYTFSERPQGVTGWTTGSPVKHVRLHNTFLRFQQKKMAH